MLRRIKSRQDEVKIHARRRGGGENDKKPEGPYPLLERTPEYEKVNKVSDEVEVAPMQKCMRDRGRNRRGIRLKRESRKIPPGSIWYVFIYKKKSYTNGTDEVGCKCPPPHSDIDPDGDIVEKIHRSPLILRKNGKVQGIDQTG
jgi:hypothetical protein